MKNSPLDSKAFDVMNRGGKRIDMNNSQKRSVVGAHMNNPNSHEPYTMEKETSQGVDNLRYSPINSNQQSNIQLAHVKRSATDLKPQVPLHSTYE